MIYFPRMFRITFGLFTLIIFGNTKEAASSVNSFILFPMANLCCQCLLQKLSYHLAQFLFNGIKIRTTISAFRRTKYENFLLPTSYQSICLQIKVPEKPDSCRQYLVYQWHGSDVGHRTSSEEAENGLQPVLLRFVADEVNMERGFLRVL
jgi:hypothetical protein